MPPDRISVSHLPPITGRGSSRRVASGCRATDRSSARRCRRDTGDPIATFDPGMAALTAARNDSDIAAPAESPKPIHQPLSGSFYRSAYQPKTRDFTLKCNPPALPIPRETWRAWQRPRPRTSRASSTATPDGRTCRPRSSKPSCRRASRRRRRFATSATSTSTRS